MNFPHVHMFRPSCSVIKQVFGQDDASIFIHPATLKTPEFHEASILCLAVLLSDSVEEKKKKEEEKVVTNGRNHLCAKTPEKNKQS